MPASSQLGLPPASTEAKTHAESIFGVKMNKFNSNETKKKCPFGSCSASASTWAISEILQPRKCEILVRNHRNYLNVDFLYVCWGTLSIICFFPLRALAICLFFFTELLIWNKISQHLENRHVIKIAFPLCDDWKCKMCHLSIDNLSGKRLLVPWDVLFFIQTTSCTCSYTLSYLSAYLY